MTTDLSGRGNDPHARFQEELGAYVTGRLDPLEAQHLDAHLTTCESCRAELVGLQPLAALLQDVDPARLGFLEQPSADLGARIVAALPARAAVDDRQDDVSTQGDVSTQNDVVPLVRRSHRRAAPQPSAWPARALSAAAVVAALLVGVVIGNRDGEPTKPVVPLEVVAVASLTEGVQATANLVPHTWGVEIKLDATGLPVGERYRAVVLDAQGREVSAGGFVGTGAKTAKCNLNASVLRSDATGFRVFDLSGREIIRAVLPAV